MYANESVKGCLRINREEDRAVVATILFRNGYTVSPVREKKNGKTYEYFVRYERKETE